MDYGQRNYPNITYQHMPQEVLERFCESLSVEDLEKYLTTDRRVLAYCRSIYERKVIEKREQLRLDKIKGKITTGGKLDIIDTRGSQIKRIGFSPKGKSCNLYTTAELMDIAWYLGIPAPDVDVIIPPDYEDNPGIFLISELVLRGIATQGLDDAKIKYYYNFLRNTTQETKSQLCNAIKAELQRTGRIVK